MSGKITVAVIGFGNLGQYLVESVNQHDGLELACVWNRSTAAMEGHISPDLILEKPEDVRLRAVDLIIEVAHPDITEKYGEMFLTKADYMIGSPTCLADDKLRNKLLAAASTHGLYIPTGAFWGGDDIRKMADRGQLEALKVTMTKHPDSFKLLGELKRKVALVTDEAQILYDGPVRGLCPLAPNNVNTMAAASLAAHTLGFDGVQGSIVADPHLLDFHIVEIEVWGKKSFPGQPGFHCKTVRTNPATVGNVTGKATYASFVSSMLGAHGQGPGIHLC